MNRRAIRRAWTRHPGETKQWPSSSDFNAFVYRWRRQLISLGLVGLREAYDEHGLPVCAYDFYVTKNPDFVICRVPGDVFWARRYHLLPWRRA